MNLAAQTMPVHDEPLFTLVASSQGTPIWKANRYRCWEVA